MTRRFHLILLTVCLVVAAALPAQQLEESYREEEVTNGASLSGSIKLAGPIPQRERITVNVNREHCGASKLSEQYLVDAAGRGLKNIVVNIEGISRGKRLPQTAYSLDNRGCMFQPHVQGVIVGKMLEVINSDPVLHTTHARHEGQRTLFNLPLPPPEPGARRSLRRPIRQSGLIVINCEVHPWMKGYIWAFTHPYFAVTDDKGNFLIEEIPPGRYKVRAWHEALGAQVKEVTLSEKGKATVNFEFTAK